MVNASKRETEEERAIKCLANEAERMRIAARMLKADSEDAAEDLRQADPEMKGNDAGHAWARDRAHPKNFRQLERWMTDNRSAPTTVEEMVEAFGSDDLFNTEGRSPVLDEAYLKGFVKSAFDIWRWVKPLVEKAN